MRLVCLILVGLLQLVLRVSSRVDASALGAPSPPVRERIVVRCDHVEDRGVQPSEEAGDERQDDSHDERVSFCWIGNRFLPALSPAYEPAPGPGLEGQLLALGDESELDPPWLRALRSDVELDARVYEVQIDVESQIGQRFAILALVVTSLVVTALGATAGWALWIRAFRRRRRAA